MKQRFLAVLLAGMLALTACQSRPSESSGSSAISPSASEPSPEQKAWSEAQAAMEWNLLSNESAKPLDIGQDALSARFSDLLTTASSYRLPEEGFPTDPEKDRAFTVLNAVLVTAPMGEAALTEENAAKLKALGLDPQTASKLVSRRHVQETLSFLYNLNDTLDATGFEGDGAVVYHPDYDAFEVKPEGLRRLVAVVLSCEETKDGYEAAAAYYQTDGDKVLTLDGEPIEEPLADYVKNTAPRYQAVFSQHDGIIWLSSLTPAA